MPQRARSRQSHLKDCRKPSKPQFVGERETVRLSEIAKIKAGNVAPKKDAFTEDGIPFVRAGSLTNLLAGGSLADLEKIDGGTAQKLRLTLFPAGTVVFAKSGMSCMTGNVYVLPKPCYVVSHLACVIPNGNYASYLEHYFRFNRPNRLIENPSFPSIKLSKIQGIELKLPSPEKGVRQVQALERIESQIGRATTLLTYLNSLVKSRFIEMFDNKRTGAIRLGDYCERITKGTTPTTAGYSFTDEGINFIKVETISELGEFIPPKIAHVSSECHAALKRSQLQENDILFSIAGAIGRTAIVVSNMLPANTNQALAIIRLKSNAPFDLLFLKQALSSSAVAAISAKLQRGAAQINLSLKDVSNFMVPCPDIELQREFAAFATQVDKSRFIAQQQIEKLQMLYDSLAQDYFGD